jgi:protocatechuate 3,4-dioxygenase beta subunit
LISRGPLRRIEVMTHVVLVLILLAGFAHPTLAQSPACAPTRPDMLGPFYKPDAPERSRTGAGLVVTGAVRSAKGCAPLSGARLEWWSADGRGDYRDDLRATQSVAADGTFTYETVPPGRYPGRPPHLHVKITAPDHKPLITQLYPRENERSITTDFILLPN